MIRATVSAISEYTLDAWSVLFLHFPEYFTNGKYLTFDTLTFRGVACVQLPKWHIFSLARRLLKHFWRDPPWNWMRTKWWPTSCVPFLGRNSFSDLTYVFDRVRYLKKIDRGANIQHYYIYFPIQLYIFGISRKTGIALFSRKHHHFFRMISPFFRVLGKLRTNFVDPSQVLVWIENI